jgi:hypothetical protein
VHKGQWLPRFLLALFGVGLALSVPTTTLITNLSAGALPAGLEPAVIFWGSAYLLAAGIGLILTLHTEVELWGCLVAGIGNPTLLSVLMTGLLPHL